MNILSEIMKTELNKTCFFGFDFKKKVWDDDGDDDKDIHGER